MPLTFTDIPKVVKLFSNHSLTKQDLQRFGSVPGRLWDWVEDQLRLFPAGTKLKLKGGKAMISSPGSGYSSLKFPQELISGLHSYQRSALVGLVSVITWGLFGSPVTALAGGGVAFFFAEKWRFQKYSFVTDGQQVFLLQSLDGQQCYIGEGTYANAKWAATRDQYLKVYHVIRRDSDRDDLRVFQKERAICNFLGVDFLNVQTALNHRGYSLALSHAMQLLRDTAVQLKAVRHMDVKPENITVQSHQNHLPDSVGVESESLVLRAHLIDIDYEQMRQPMTLAKFGEISHTFFKDRDDIPEIPEIQNELYIKIRESLCCLTYVSETEQINKKQVDDAMQHYDVFCLAFTFYESIEDLLQQDSPMSALAQMLNNICFDALSGQAVKTFEELIQMIDEFARDQGVQLECLETELDDEPSFLSEEMIACLDEAYGREQDRFKCP